MLFVWYVARGHTRDHTQRARDRLVLLICRKSEYLHTPKGVSDALDKANGSRHDSHPMGFEPVTSESNATKPLARAIGRQ